MWGDRIYFLDVQTGSKHVSYHYVGGLVVRWILKAYPLLERSVHVVPAGCSLREVPFVLENVYAHNVMAALPAVVGVTRFVDKVHRPLGDDGLGVAMYLDRHSAVRLGDVVFDSNGVALVREHRSLERPDLPRLQHEADPVARLPVARVQY